MVDIDADTQGALDATRARLMQVQTLLLEVCELAGDEEVSDYLAHAFADQTDVQSSLDEVAFTFGTAAQDRYRTWEMVREATPDNEWWRTKQHALQEGYFDIDGQFGRLRGLHNPWHRWNGWATPWFPIESVVKIQAAIERQNKENDGQYVQHFTIDDDGVWLWVEDNADEYDDPRGRLEACTVVDGVTLYDIGQGGWCWDEVTKDGWLA